MARPRSPSSRAGTLAGPQSARRLLAVLDQFSAERPTHTVDDLSQATGVPRSTVYRLVGLLREHKMIEIAAEGHYALGPRAVVMGYVARSMVTLADLWRPVLQHLAEQTHETTLIMRRIDDAAVCLDRVECDHPVRLSFDVGRAMPLHTGAGAKVLLALSPAEYQDSYLSKFVPKAQRKALRSELQRIADLGIGESHAEVDPGIWAVAVPVLAERDLPLVLSVALPDFRLHAGRDEELRQATIEAASDLRQKLPHYI